MTEKRKALTTHDNQPPDHPRQAHLDVEQSIPPSVRDAWLCPLKSISFEDNEVVFEASDQFTRQWVIDHHLKYSSEFGGGIRRNIAHARW